MGPFVTRLGDLDQVGSGDVALASYSDYKWESSEDKGLSDLGTRNIKVRQGRY